MFRQLLEVSYLVLGVAPAKQRHVRRLKEMLPEVLQEARMADIVDV